MQAAAYRPHSHSQKAHLCQTLGAHRSAANAVELLCFDACAALEVITQLRSQLGSQSRVPRGPTRNSFAASPPELPRAPRARIARRLGPASLAALLAP